MGRFFRCPIALFCSAEQACHPSQCLVTPLTDLSRMQSVCRRHLTEGLVFAQYLAHYFRFEFWAVTVSHSVFHPLIFTLFYCPIYGVHHTSSVDAAEEPPKS